MIIAEDYKHSSNRNRWILFCEHIIPTHPKKVVYSSEKFKTYNVFYKKCKDNSQLY